MYFVERPIEGQMPDSHAHAALRLQTRSAKPGVGDLIPSDRPILDVR
jgi:hypothetical protein